MRTLRWKLTLAYVGLLIVLLVGLGTFQYFALRNSLIVSHAETLNGIFKASKSIVLQRAASILGSNIVVRNSQCLSAGTPDIILSNIVAKTISDVSGHTVVVIVYDNSGGVIDSEPISINLDIPHKSLSTILDGESLPATVITSTQGDMLAVGFPVKDLSSIPCGAIVLATSFSPISNVLNDDKAFVILGSIFVVLLALILGLLLTKRSLQPLKRLTVTAEELAGGDLRARSRLIPRKDEVGELTRAFDDMAERIETLFVEQKESEEKTRRFIADASHELRTPVTTLKGFIDVLRRGAAHDETSLQAALESMAKEAERMRLLVVDLLALARFDTQPVPEPVKDDVDIVNLVNSILDEGVPNMPDSLERDFPDSPVIVMGDSNALALALRNVLLNACKYAPGARQLWRITEYTDQVILSIHDEGAGIDPRDLPHIFERFYRGEKTRSRDEGGSGLGLSIVEGVVKAHGGSITIDSEINQGTTVTINLPCVIAKMEES